MELGGGDMASISESTMFRQREFQFFAFIEHLVDDQITTVEDDFVDIVLQDGDPQEDGTTDDLLVKVDLPIQIEMGDFRLIEVAKGGWVFRVTVQDAHFH